MSKKGFLPLILVVAAVLFLTGATQVFADSQTGFAKTAVNDNSYGSFAWTRLYNIAPGDGGYVVSAATGEDKSNYLWATDCGFSIPLNATINGITVTVEHYFNTSSNYATDASVRLVREEMMVGEDRAIFSNWNPLVVNYGSANDRWGYNWTAAEINSSKFGVAMAANFSGYGYGNIDYVKITVDYTVPAYRIDGFYGPVDMKEGFYNLVKGGSTVPLKFEIFDGSNEITNTAAVTQIGGTFVDCSEIIATHLVDTDALTSGNTSLRYDTEQGVFVFNWKTPRRASGCYRLTVKTYDEVSKSVYFEFK